MVFSGAWALAPRWAKAMGGFRNDSMTGLYEAGTIGPVSAVWLLLVPVVLVGGFFLIRGFVRVAAALKGLQASLDEMSQAGLRLRDLRGDLDKLTETMQRGRPR